jgi:eukaryotic-like serine/threonine-protein kinase
VPSPGSCLRCSKPLALASPSGLCPECAATDDTPAQTFPEPVRVGPAPPDPTLTAADPGGTTATNAPGTDRAPLPHAPPGYDHIDRLGSGGMGSVYLARELASDRLVAMKFLHHPGNPESYERFLVELRILAQLDHPNIVRVLSSDFLRADPFFTMEYMPGGSLSRALDASTPVPVAEAIRLVRIVCDAVTAAHAQGVIHRDLKPSNILLAADGTPKVSDFGLAKRLEHDDQLTVASGALGTPSYMPPEQVSRKNGEIGPWSDVYGLGATLYHLLVGRAPFVGETPLEIIELVLADPAPRLRAIRAEIPKELEGIVLKCLEKDPKDRYQSVAELAADLDRFTAGQKPVAPPLTYWRRVKRWVRRNRRGAGGAAAAAVLVAVAFVLGAAYWPKPKPVDPPDPIAEMRKELTEGRAAVPVGDRGLPRWHEWRAGAAALAESEAHEGACCFDSTKYALLDLFPRVGLKRYRVTVQIKQLEGTDAGDAGDAKRPLPTAAIGLYLAEGPFVGPGEVVAHPLLALMFNDYDSKAALGKPPTTRAALLRDATFIQRPNAQPALAPQPAAQHTFQPAPRHPGPWRTVRIEVTPESFQAFWLTDDKGEDGKTFVPFRPITGAVTAATRQERLRTRLDGTAPGFGTLAPPWDPAQLTVGVFCHRAGIAVRRCVIEPLD